mgnify:CR=1 FL=1
MISINFTTAKIGQVIGNIENDSLQIGDFVYYVTPATVGSFNHSTADPVFIGDVTAILPSYIQVNNTGTDPSAGDFIMFAKESSVNVSGLVGYFAEVELRNNSKEKAEIYTVSSEITVSSK